MTPQDGGNEAGKKCRQTGTDQGSGFWFLVAEAGKQWQKATRTVWQLTGGNGLVYVLTELMMENGNR